jgi:uncharacterized protein with FMN-binding domain
MRRALITTAATVVGVVYILNFKVTPHVAALAEAPAAQGEGVQPATPGASTPPPTTPTPANNGVLDGTFTGPSVFVRFGNVQVRIVVSGGRVADLQAIDLPSDRSRSVEISQFSGPVLRQEAIRAQSARINVVSGATYTSFGYAQSIEGALQQAHLG